MAPRATPHRRAPSAAWAGTAFGGVGIIAGTFLPWTISGRVRRNLFELGDVAGRLGVLGTVPLGLAFLVPLLCAVPTLLLALGLARTAGLVAVPVSIAALLGSGAALLGAGPRGGGIVQIAVAGPVVTAAAALLLLVAGLVAVRWRRSPRHAGNVPGDAVASPPFAPYERDATP